MNPRPWSQRFALAIAATAGFYALPAQAAPDTESLELVRSRQAPKPQLHVQAGDADALRWDRQLQWTRLTLAEQTPLSDDDRVQGPAYGLAVDLSRMDIRQSIWSAAPRASSTVASAIASFASRGIPVLVERRDGRLLRRHRLAFYVGTRRVGATWRLEF